jgi:hypothetical protein
MPVDRVARPRGVIESWALGRGPLLVSRRARLDRDIVPRELTGGPPQRPSRGHTRTYHCVLPKVCPDNASGRVKRAPGPDFAKDPPTLGRVWGQCSAGLGPKPTVHKVLIG